MEIVHSDSTAGQSEETIEHCDLKNLENISEKGNQNVSVSLEDQLNITEDPVTWPERL